jgi:hypothetical protein
MSNTAYDAAKKEKLKALKKAVAKKSKSLSIRIQESDLYDWDSTARMTLLVIALGQRVNEDAWVQEDCPWSGEEMLGWCDMAQWRIALRVGKSENRIQKVITQLEKDGVLIIERWTDSNMADHDRYQIVEAVVDEHQRPEQKRGVERPSRYKVKRGTNKGSFSTANQPGKNREVREMDEDE